MKENKLSTSWWVPLWTMGFLFTLGYAGLAPEFFSSMSFLEKVLSWILWPAILGSNLAK